MTNKMIIPLVLSLAFLVCCVSGAPGNSHWPTWMGPEKTGVSPDGNPPVKWSETDNIKWKVKLDGDGSNSSPVIWGDKIFFQTAVDTGKEGLAPADSGQGGRGPGGKSPKTIYKFNMVCLDRTSGKTLWEKTVCEVQPHEGHHGDHGFVSFTPATDGKLVWANFGSQGVFCFDLDGNLKWSKDLGKMTIRAGFGEGGSLVLAGDKVIVLHDHEGDSSIAALNKNTGDIVWKKDRDERTSWTTPIVTEAGGKMQVIAAGANKSRSYDAATGDLIWECGGQTDNVIPTPVLAFDRVLCLSGFRGAMLQAIRLDRTGDLTGTDAVAWEVKDATPYVPSPLLYGERLYFFSGIKNILSCYNARTGEPFYTKQELGEMNGVYASPVGAAGRVYCVGRNGVTYVLKNADTLEVLSINKLDDSIDCTPAVVCDELYLKGKQYLYCIAESK